LPLIGGKMKKVYVDGVGATIIAEWVEYLDENGKLVTESLRDFTKKALKKRFGSLDDFLKRWKAAERKEAIVEELESEGPLASLNAGPAVLAARSLRNSLLSPANHVGFNQSAGPDAVPSAVNPKTGKRKYVGADVIFTKQFHQFPGWRFTV
jgi:hypothetical protein